ncbi:hypothetical protein J4H86_15725 [Spiractinospora alimapuensis]|uniref:hypothetical protein n=1 Tax=Spiractinospora alimapuensis TaxID=2820884 RepID=UPI001F4454BE|nr:hypothetical protein [Spiractinospora alimapuensis]QVQ50380.1 hypothetical protein J4H86_15725 [Spiractinospora alimapuensis]
MRSRNAMRIVVGIVVVGLVASMGYGFISARHAPEPPPAGAPELEPAPSMDSLGTPPNRVEYADLGEICEVEECFRAVSVSSEDLSAEEAIDTIYTTLLDRGMGRMLPPGEEDPEEVDWVDSALTDNTVVIQGSDQPPSPEAEEDGAIAHLVITHAAESES